MTARSAMMPRIDVAIRIALLRSMMLLQLSGTELDRHSRGDENACSPFPPNGSPQAALHLLCWQIAESADYVDRSVNLSQLAGQDDTGPGQHITKPASLLPVGDLQSRTMGRP